MSITKTIQQMVDALASIANEPDRTLQQRPVRFAKAKEAIQAGRVLLESIAKQEHGEPVAWMWLFNGEVWDLSSVKDRYTAMSSSHVQVPLYTTPQPVTESHKRNQLPEAPL